MLKMKLKVDYPVTLFSPRGYESLTVEPGNTVDVPGDLVTSRPAPKKDEPEPTPLPDDAYIVVNNGEEKAWPHALWVLVDDKPAAKAAAVKEN